MATIKTITLKDGSKRYRFVVDIPHGKDEKRRQETHTYTTLKEAKAELARLEHQTRTGEYVGRWNGTVSDLCDRYLRYASAEASENTKVSYRVALMPVRDMLGVRRARDIDRDDIEALKDHLLTKGRKRGGKPGTGLGARSVRLTLGRLSAAYELAIMDRLLTYNPVRYVKQPKVTRTEHATWSAADVRAFLAEATTDRLHAAWRMTCYGLRRGEVLGLRWDDERLPARLKGTAAVDTEAGTLTIGWTRVLVDGQVIEKGPKSDNGYRTLPLDDTLLVALRALHRKQAAEKLAAGPGYEDTGYVVTDELGRPVEPEWYSDEFQRVSVRAGLSRIRLHDNRHTSNSLMAAANVPAHIRAAWHGHTEAVNEGTYTHARPEDMAVAQAALLRVEKGV